MMRRLCILVVWMGWHLGWAAAVHAAAPATVRSTFDQLMALRCDIRQFGIATPLEARVLRNVPYAVAGQRFASPELTAVFTRDGGWYRPSDAPAPLDPAHAACARTLQQYEARLRRTVPMRPEVEAIFTRDPSVFLHLRAAPGATLRVIDAGTKTGHRWHWSAIDPTACGGDGAPEHRGDCAGLSIDCEIPDGSTDLTQLVCQVIRAG